VLVELIERRGVKDIRAGFGAIECEQANMIVANFALNHQAG